MNRNKHSFDTTASLPRPEAPEERTTGPATPLAISARAYQLWEQRGKTGGSALEDWLQAERELRGRSRPAIQ